MKILTSIIILSVIVFSNCEFHIVKKTGRYFSTNIEESINNEVFSSLFVVDCGESGVTQINYGLIENCYSHDGGLFSGYQLRKNCFQFVAVMDKKDNAEFGNALRAGEIHLTDSLSYDSRGGLYLELGAKNLFDEIEFKYDIVEDGQLRQIVVRFKRILNQNRIKF